ncbi:DUF4365 domain-containing protein [Rhodococcus sp. NPDC019627]|uniref:DUF4365 domain-containing protein n=1 Tax=unclassified Rhodococcus (in: high G+C Gram-positive bacteria) TaxID=192944 RepID=UPI003410D2D2
MATSWVTSRRAVNEVRILFEKHAQIVQEIDGGSDLGEDLIVSLTEGGIRTGDRILVQVKGGVSFRRSSGGYAISVRKHRQDWIYSSIPVICIVYDPELRKLFWINATQKLRESAESRLTSTSIVLEEHSVLDDRSTDAVLRTLRTYIIETGCTPEVGSRMRSGRRHRGGAVVADGPIGGVPNPVFSPISEWVERSRLLLMRIAIVMCFIVIVGAFVLMWPTLWWFAEPSMGSKAWMWALMVVGFTPLCIAIARSEIAAGRSGRLPVVFSYFYAIPTYIAINLKLGIVDLSDGLRAAFVATIPSLIKYTLFGFIGVYVARELARRRRVRAAYGSQDPDH